MVKNAVLVYNCGEIIYHPITLSREMSYQLRSTSIVNSTWLILPTTQFTEFKKVEAYGPDGKLLKDKQGNPLKRLTPVKAQVMYNFSSASSIRYFQRSYFIEIC